MWKTGILIALTASIGFAADSAQTRPASQTPEQRSPAAPAPDKVLIEGTFDNTNLDEICVYLSHITGANIVLTRDPGVPADYPHMGNIDVKNVGLSQFLDVLAASYDGIHVEKIEGPQSAVFLIRISLVHKDAAAGAGPVRVFRLSEAVAAQEDSAGTPGIKLDEKSALDNVLSLIQAALQQAGDLDGCVLKVHAPTKSLIFRGSEQDARIVAEAIAAAHAPASQGAAGDWTGAPVPALPTTNPAAGR